MVRRGREYITSDFFGSFGCFWLSSENIFLFLVFWETPKQLLNALNFNQTRAQDKALRIGGTRYAGEQYHRHPQRRRKLVGRFCFETATLTIKLKDCVTDIRYQYGGELEVINSKTA